MDNLTSSVQPSEILTLAQAIEFVFKKKFMDFYCLTIAKVLSVNDNNLTIQPMINFKLADGTSQIPPQISIVPFGIIAGGNSAIIIPYVENDIVLVGFIDREFNALKQDNTTAITPELIRMHNIADAFVIMNWGNGKTPTTVIKMNDTDGIEITSANNINILTNGGGIDITSEKDVNITSKGTGGVNIIAQQGSVAVTAQPINGNVTVTAENIIVKPQGPVATSRVILGGSTALLGVLYGSAASPSVSTNVFIGTPGS